MLKVPIGGTSVVYLQASCLLWRYWICTNVKTWKQILWNQLEWTRWVHCIPFHLVTNSCCVLLWEVLDVSYSNWGDVSCLFAGELPSLKKLNMVNCNKLKTDSMESIGMNALGTFLHVSFNDRFLLRDLMRGSKCLWFQLGGRQQSICRRVALFEEIEHGWM